MTHGYSRVVQGHMGLKPLLKLRDINILAGGNCLHTAGVAGSIPAAPTNPLKCLADQQTVPFGENEPRGLHACQPPLSRRGLGEGGEGVKFQLICEEDAPDKPPWDGDWYLLGKKKREQISYHRQLSPRKHKLWTVYIGRFDPQYGWLTFPGDSTAKPTHWTPYPEAPEDNA